MSRQINYLRGLARALTERVVPNNLDIERVTGGHRWILLA